MITCPYCGLPEWSIIQSMRKGVNERIFLCRCNNCNRVFYLFKTRLNTYTIRLEDVELR